MARIPPSRQLAGLQSCLAPWRAGWAAWVAISLLNRLTFSWQGLDPDWFVSRLYIEGVSRGMLGAVSVYVGSKIAPAQKEATVFVLAFLFVLGAGVLLFPAIRSEKLVGDVPAPWPLRSGQVVCAGLSIQVRPTLIDVHLHTISGSLVSQRYSTQSGDSYREARRDSVRLGLA